MDERDKIYSWLQRAFEEQVDMINESYYFDRRDNQFYSVFITDLLLINDDFDIEPSKSPYSENELHLLRDRMNRQSDNDSSIVCIPRLTIEERKQMMQDFLVRYPDILNIKEVQKNIDLENGRTSLNFRNILKDGLAHNWDVFKRNFIIDKADSFCNLQNISIERASLWVDDKLTSISLDLKNDSAKEEPPKNYKPWWKFW